MERFSKDELEFFVRESNAIEAIRRDPTKAELEEAERFLKLEQVTVQDLERFVKVYEPRALLRSKKGMNVIIGKHTPPSGGPIIPDMLMQIVENANNREHPFDVHQEYETLHPFLDGNGRSGRILWAYQMVRQNFWPNLQLGFLHCWYYQSLDQSRRLKGKVK